MKCPFLSGKYMSSCTAQKEGYVPSAFELEEYCVQVLYPSCPVYVNRNAYKEPTARAPLHMSA